MDVSYGGVAMAGGRATIDRAARMPGRMRRTSCVLAFALLASVLSCSASGSPATVRTQLQAFIDRTRPDELMITSQMYDHAARLRSYEIAAEVRDALVAPS